jgi:hypothetical protein
MDEASRDLPRGFVLFGFADVASGAEGVILSARLGDDFYHFRYFNLFQDPGVGTPSDNRFILRADGSPIEELYLPLVFPYISKRHLLDISGVAPRRALLELVYLNNSGVAGFPQVSLTGFRSRYFDRIV